MTRGHSDKTDRTWNSVTLLSWCLFWQTRRSEVLLFIINMMIPALGIIATVSCCFVFQICHKQQSILYLYFDIPDIVLAILYLETSRHTVYSMNTIGYCKKRKASGKGKTKCRILDAPGCEDYLSGHFWSNNVLLVCFDCGI